MLGGGIIAVMGHETCDHHGIDTILLQPIFQVGTGKSTRQRLRHEVRPATADHHGMQLPATRARREQRRIRWRGLLDHNHRNVRLIGGIDGFADIAQRVLHRWVFNFQSAGHVFVLYVDDEQCAAGDGVRTHRGPPTLSIASFSTGGAEPRSMRPNTPSWPPAVKNSVLCGWLSASFPKAMPCSPRETMT